MICVGGSPSGEEITSVAAVVVPLLGVVVSGFFAWMAHKASRSAATSAEQANRIAEGQAETEMRNGISAARQRVEDLLFRAEDVALLPEPENSVDMNTLRRRRDRVLAAVRAAVEEYLNRYDMACGQYLAGSVADEDRFEEAYGGEVRSLCETEKNFIRERMHPTEESSYQQLWAVYRQWYPDDREEDE